MYLLLGQDQGGAPLAYIGESENISDRIKTHDAKKEWWTDAVPVMMSANNLNKAHVKYLEAALIEQAQSIGRMKLANGTAPPRPGLSEAARSNMEAFLDYLYMVLPALRVDMFIENAKPNSSAPTPTGTAETPAFELVNKKHVLRATATLVEGEFRSSGPTRPAASGPTAPTARPRTRPG